MYIGRYRNLNTNGGIIVNGNKNAVKRLSSNIEAELRRQLATVNLNTNGGIIVNGNKNAVKRLSSNIEAELRRQLATVEEELHHINVARCILDEGGDLPLDVKQGFLLPAWYDEQKFRRGQKFFNENYFSLFVSKLSGLLVILAVPSILRVLILTGQSSHPLSAFRRYLDTISHMLEWYDGDLTNPNSRASKSLLSVRGRHCYATRRASKAGFGQISQRDMALTQFGFMGFALLRSNELGLSGSNADLEGFVHFWRTIGYLLGIKDKYNLCQGDLKTTRETCQAMLDRVFVVGLKQNSPDFEEMSRALLEGMWAVVPFINTEAFFGFTKMLCGIDNVQFTNIYSKSLFNIQVFMHTIILNSFIAAIIRPILNFNMWLALFMSQRFPYLAFLAFGRNITAPEQYTIKSSVATEQCT